MKKKSLYDWRKKQPAAKQYIIQTFKKLHQQKKYFLESRKKEKILNYEIIYAVNLIWYAFINCKLIRNWIGPEIQILHLQGYLINYSFRLCDDDDVSENGLALERGVYIALKNCNRTKWGQTKQSWRW